MNTVLRACGLVKTYTSDGDDEVAALRGVDLAVQRGEFVSVMGPSGCGKSTLLQLLGGLDRPTAGEVHLDDERLDTMSEARRAVLRRRRVGFVFQFFNLVPNLSVADNVELPALLAGVPAAEARKRAAALLDELGIAAKGRDVPWRLSGGQQQRVALARALVNAPDVLLADEPTGNLDSTNARGVLDLLRRHHECGQTVVLVTHDARVASTAGRVVQMRDGEIVGETAMSDGAGDPARVVSALLELEA